MKTSSTKKVIGDPGVRIERHDTTRTLGDPNLVFRTFMECLQEGDSKAALEVLAGGLRHMNKSSLARRHRIPRRTIYNLLDNKSSPTLDLVAKVCRAIRLESGRKTLLVDARRREQRPFRPSNPAPAKDI